MNHTTTPQFNPIHYAKKMTAIGFTQQQAEGQAEALIEIIDNNLATKTDVFLIQRDIEASRLASKNDIEALRLSTKSDISLVQKDIEAVKVEIEKSKNETIKWLGLIITLATTIIGLLITRYHS